MVQGYALNKESQEGRKVLSLVGSRYGEYQNKEDSSIPIKERFEDVSTLLCRVNNVRILLSDSYTGLIKRPMMCVNASVLESSGRLNDVIDSVKFMEDEQPTIDYMYELSDDNLKKLIDAGLYANPNFEKSLNRIIKEEDFECDSNIVFHHVMVPSLDEKGQVVPIIVGDLASVIDSRKVHDDHDLSYTSFGDILEHSADIVETFRTNEIKEMLAKNAEYAHRDEVIRLTDLDEVVSEEDLVESIVSNEADYGVVDQEIDTSSDVLASTSRSEMLERARKMTLLREAKAHAEAVLDAEKSEPKTVLAFEEEDSMEF